MYAGHREYWAYRIPDIKTLMYWTTNAFDPASHDGVIYKLNIFGITSELTSHAAVLFQNTK